MKGQDRRVMRTRSSLIHAFNQLVLQGRPRKIRVADIVERANVGRSTFYEHYRSADDIFMAALAGPFELLADAAAGRGDPGRLERLLEHFWDNRKRARDSFSGRTGERAARLLASQVEQRLVAGAGASLVLPLRLVSLQLAEAALAPIRGWVAGEASCSAAALARAICSSGVHLLAALHEPPTQPDC